MADGVGEQLGATSSTTMSAKMFANLCAAHQGAMHESWQAQG